jgi:transposase-like protein
MIPQFTKICKRISEIIKKTARKKSEEEIYEEAVARFKKEEAGCPECGAIGKLNPYGNYWRNMVYHEDPKINDGVIKIVRYKCGSCGRTHALLPDILVPYSPYTLIFKLTVLLAYYKRDKTAVKICEYYKIAVSTLYAWKKKLLEHKELLMGVVESKKTDAMAFVRGLFESEDTTDSLQGFYAKYGFSFLQNKRNAHKTTQFAAP